MTQREAAFVADDYVIRCPSGFPEHPDGGDAGDRGTRPAGRVRRGAAPGGQAGGALRGPQRRCPGSRHRTGRGRMRVGATGAGRTKAGRNKDGRKNTAHERRRNGQAHLPRMIGWRANPARLTESVRCYAPSVAVLDGAGRPPSLTRARPRPQAREQPCQRRPAPTGAAAPETSGRRPGTT
jgi:hypothetical protein